MSDFNIKNKLENLVSANYQKEINTAEIKQEIIDKFLEMEQIIHNFINPKKASPEDQAKWQADYEKKSLEDYYDSPDGH